MTQQQIIDRIQNGENVSITARELLSSCGGERLTSGNITRVNNFLNRNCITCNPAINSCPNLWTNVELTSMYPINTNGFHLYRLKIDNWRNLNNIDIDFSNTENYSCFIGLNGSGKSNVLEAVCLIFKSLYQNRRYLPFHYKLVYSLRVPLTDGNSKIQLFNIEDGTEVSGRSIVPPQNLIASYSGEDKRLWEASFKDIYTNYCSRIATIPSYELPKMLYISKDEWAICFLTLLYESNTNTQIQDFLNSIIGTDDCEIRFTINQPNLDTWRETPCKQFVKQIRNLTPYTKSDFVNFVDTYEVAGSPIDSIILFNYLYQSTVKSGVFVITNIDIKFQTKGNLDTLSEGEKKIIEVYTIQNILSSDRTLCIFDEPDSHVHISRKSEMLEVINTTGHYSLVTTHSPTFLNHVEERNTFFMKDGKKESLDKLKSISELTGGEINYFDGAFVLSSKKILIVEGPYDKRYLEKAISIFSNRDNRYQKLKSVTIVPADSAGNAYPMYENFFKDNLDMLDKIVFLFDFDDGGYKGWKSIYDKLDSETKVSNIFYQDNYSTVLPVFGDPANRKNPNKPSNDKSTWFMVEDLFHTDSYRSIVDEIHTKVSHKDFRVITEGTASKIKSHIEKHYKTFDEAWFDGFKPVLDKLMEEFGFII